MSLFGKTSPNAKEIKRSEELVKKKIALEDKFPEIEKTWNDQDTQFVRLGRGRIGDCLFDGKQRRVS